MKRIARWTHSIFVVVAGLLLLPTVSFAHEAYVLSEDVFHNNLERTSLDAFRSLTDPGNLTLFFIIAGSVLFVLFLNFKLRHSGIGRAINLKIRHWGKYGPVVVRLAIGLAFIYSSITASFLGPEIPLETLPFPEVLRIFIGAAGVMFVLGMFTEVAAAIGLLIFGLALFEHGSYLLTYTNYLGELVVLFLLGTHFLSLDKLFFGKAQRFKRLQKFETFIIRVGYGFALMYAAVTIKLLHPYVTVTVVEQYNLTQFSWLFPSDPLLITLGAALAELAIGFFILIGWETRLVVLVSLFYITLSLIFFGEAVWPHFILYGVSISLLLNDGGDFTLDNYFDRNIAKRQSRRTKHTLREAAAVERA